MERISKEQSLPQNPILVSAIQARLLQDHLAVARLCAEFEITTKSIKSSSLVWDQIHFEMLNFGFLEQASASEDQVTQFLDLNQRISSFELAHSFLYLYELSGLLIRTRQYVQGHSFAMRAEGLAFDENSRLSSLLNRLICEEALGSDISIEIRSLDLILRRISKKTVLNPKINIEFQALYLRFLFRRGRLKELDFYRGPQSLYLEWLRALPHFGLKSRPLQIPKASEQIYSPFVLNTLLFRRTQKDRVSPPPNHWADRLYLWTWTALVQPQRISVLSVLQWMADCPFETWTEAWTQEDRKMLSHCFKLLSLFDPSSRRKVHLFIQSLGPLNYEDHPYLAEEVKFIEALLSMSQGDQKKESMVGEFSNPFFKDLLPLKSWRLLEKLPGLKSSCLAVLKMNYSKMIVDPIYGRVWDRLNKVWMTSDAVAQGLAFLLGSEAKSAASMVDLMESAFGIPQYDEFAHYRKVYNLLSRIKALSPESFKFSIRRQSVSFSIRAVDYQCLAFPTENEFDVRLWRKILKRVTQPLLKIRSEASGSGPDDLVKIFEFHGSLTRSEFQKFSRTSRPKAIRNLNELISQELLERRGRGKNITYRLRA